MAQGRGAALGFGFFTAAAFDLGAVLRAIWELAGYPYAARSMAATTQANYRAWVLSELGTQTIPYAMSDQS